MMKRLAHILIILLTFIGSRAFAQAPERINYQAVARDLSGNPLVSQSLSNVMFEIRQGSPSGTVVYRETQTLSTNRFGLFTAEIGGGTPTIGTFSGIDWGVSSYYLQITIGSDVMPATQLLSVPYALYSKESLNGPKGADGADGNDNLSKSTPEPVGLNCLNGGTKVESGVDDNGNGVLDASEIDFTYYTCNGRSGLGDNWGSDVVSTSGSNISGDGTVTNPLIVVDGDASDTNEIQVLEQAANLITLTKGGGAIQLLDNDPNNERISTFRLNSSSDSLVIVESGVRHAFPLSNLNDGDWTRGTGNTIYNASDKIGIGTNSVSDHVKLSVVDGHIESQQADPPIIALLNSNGIGSPSLDLRATDTKGIITTTGQNTSTNYSQVAVTFNKTYNNVPVVVITPANEAAASYKFFVETRVNGFSVNFNGGLGSPVWNYIVLE